MATICTASWHLKPRFPTSFRSSAGQNEQELQTKEVDQKQDSHVGRGFGDGRMARQDIFRMIKKRCSNAALGAAANCHTFRATGITAYLVNGGSLEHAQAIAAHESPRTTKLYDRTSDEITLDEIERIGI
jgi:site-specific recombinase XerD